MNTKRGKNTKLRASLYFLLIPIFLFILAIFLNISIIKQFFYGRIGSWSFGNPSENIIFSEKDLMNDKNAELFKKKILKIIPEKGIIRAAGYLPTKKDLYIELIDENPNKTISKIAYWTINRQSNKPERISLDNNIYKRIYTKENPKGGADILLEDKETKVTEKIGFLKEKIIEVTVCENRNCRQKNPCTIVPSFNGELLFGHCDGGLGSYSKVISRDGSKIYNFNFFKTSDNLALWIGNNKLLTSVMSHNLNSDGFYPKDLQIFTFFKDRSYQKESKSITVDHFDQYHLSPSRVKLAVIKNGKYYDDPNELSILDLQDFSEKTVDLFGYTPERELLDVLGWDNQSRYLFYTTVNWVKIYDSSLEKMLYNIRIKKDSDSWGMRESRINLIENVYQMKFRTIFENPSG